MEPVLELAIHITSHLWLLHELYPGEGSVRAALAMSWQAELAKRAGRDYSYLQGLLDLTGNVAADDWDPSQPLRRFSPGQQLEPEKFRLRDPMHWFSARRTNRALRRQPAQDLRAVAASAALQVLERRFTALEKLAAAIDFVPETRTGDQSFAASLLTREDLFYKIANWLLTAGSEQVAALFDAFLPAELLLEQEITGRANAIAGSRGADLTQRAVAEDWARKTGAQRKAVLADRILLRQLCKDLEVPVPFSLVLADELDEIAFSRAIRLYGADPTTLAPQAPGTEPPTPEARTREARDAADRAAAARKQSGVAPDCTAPSQQAFQSQLFGLALSGGGIRSATFALGLLQGMADRNILPYIDVLSTVSGGGYIGTWLNAWIKRRGGVSAVQQSLRGAASYLLATPGCAPPGAANRRSDVPDPLALVTHNSDPQADHVRPVRVLREYARYLAPQAGLFSADFWTIVATWFRNTALNLGILVFLFGALLLIPRIAIYFLLHLRRPMYQTLRGPAEVLIRVLPGHLQLRQVSSGLALLITGLPILWGCRLIGKYSLATFGSYRGGRGARGSNDVQIVTRVMPWIVAGSFLQIAVIWNIGITQRVANAASAVFCIVFMAGALVLWHYTPPWAQAGRGASATRRRIAVIAAFLCSAVVGFGLAEGFCAALNTLGMNTQRGLWEVGSFGLALMITIIGAILVVFLGLAGRELSDEQREWWSRLGAWYILVIGGWLVVCAISFFMPLWLALLGLQAAAAGLSWAAISAAGAKIAFSPESGRDQGMAQGPVRRAIMNIAPTVFVIGTLSAVSFGLFWALQWLIDWRPDLSGNPVAHQLCCSTASLSLAHMVDLYWPLMDPGSFAPVLLLILFGALCLLLAWRVDINEFSMHHFYKNRLVRAYLGASRARAHRFPNAFTGFDPEDDIRLSRFQHADPTRPSDMARDCKASFAGPYPIINTALNVTRGENLGIQERKAESFVFTPLWSGFDFSRRQTTVREACLAEYAFQRTDRFGEPDAGGVLAGTAMAISGAAFSSNAGFHTSPALAFLLTVFGVRLGWWAGNPRGSSWTQPSPALGLLYLIKEASANTTTSSNFVLLSDGGHFENMGLYELVRRRCRFIIVSDAEEDIKFKLEGIGGAIRKCRDDFGVVIDLNLDALQPVGDPAVSRLHYSMGRIIYPEEKDCGRLIYIKSSVTGDEPLDIIEFRKRHAEFPHTSTANQFFDESHFESYRELGQHVASGIFVQDMPPLPLAAGESAGQHVRKMFDRIEQAWNEQLNAAPKARADTTSAEEQRS